MAEQTRGQQRRRGDGGGGGDETGDDGDPAVRCTGKNCQSCTAGAIADCVAVCCCPCAVVNLLTLVIIKIPWMVGRRLCSRGLARRRKKKKKRKTKCLQYEAEMGGGGGGEPRREKVDEGSMEMSFGLGLGLEEKMMMMGGFEAENVNNVWLEFHPVGHLSFGRVSFTGIQFPCCAEEQLKKLHHQSN